jgi:plastocyanin
MHIGRVLTLLLLTACGGDGPNPPEGCTDPVVASTVELADFAFRPDCLSVDVGATIPMTITLENTGDAPHTFTVDGTDVSFDVPAGETAEGTLSGVTPGRYEVTCIYHPQMTATLEINP